MKNSLRIHKWTHNEFNIFILGVLTHPLTTQIFQFHPGNLFPGCLQSLAGILPVVFS